MNESILFAPCERVNNYFRLLQNYFIEPLLTSSHAANYIAGMMLNSYDKIITALGGTGDVASALDQSASTVSGWRTRGIPAHHWRALVTMAASRKVDGVSLEVLAQLAAWRPVETRGVAKIGLKP